MTHWGHTDRHYMAKANIVIIAEYGAWLEEHTAPGDTFADWMEYYLSVAATYVSDAYHAWERMGDEYRARIGRHAAAARNPHAMSYMARKNIAKLAEYGAKFEELVYDDEPLPDWMEHKLSVARRYLGDVKHSIEHQLREGHHGQNGFHNARKHLRKARRVMPHFVNNPWGRNRGRGRDGSITDKILLAKRTFVFDPSEHNRAELEAWARRLGEDRFRDTVGEDFYETFRRSNPHVPGWRSIDL